MNELKLIERIRKKLPASAARGLVLGIGDDCAIFRPSGSSEDLVFTTDMLLEDIHFRRETHPAEAVGHKALARGLSDIAAMGAAPRFCLLSLAVPGWADQRWVDRFYRGFLRLAGSAGTLLAGGDLAHSDKFASDIVVCGSVPRGKALRRDGARAGDRIYVSGSLGGSALGLSAQSGPAWEEHLRPAPRLALGQFLRRRGLASAAMDLSDGLSLDLHRLCLQSGVAAEIDGPVPIWPGATLEQALHGGEDYELLFAVPPRKRLPKEFEGLALTRIGVFTYGRPGQVKLQGRPIRPQGYDHFSSRGS